MGFRKTLLGEQCAGRVDVNGQILSRGLFGERSLGFVENTGNVYLNGVGAFFVLEERRQEILDALAE